jgi:hypothetical protein
MDFTKIFKNMTNNSYPNVKLLITSILSRCKELKKLKECRKNFITNALTCFLSIKGRINFLQMERFSEKCEQYFRINFENKFNFQNFNLSLIKKRVTECILAFDPSYISKSGKHTYGLGMYWSGCAARPKHGLEICGFAAVDIPQNTAFHLNAIQTPKSKEINLLQYYCQIIKENYLYFKELTNYLVADSFFAKSDVVQTITTLGMHFISRLRDDAVLFYLNREPKTGKKGAPKKYAGRVKPGEPDMNFFTLCCNTDELKVYNAIVYCKAFKQIINLSITVFYKNGKEVARKLYFSTDLKMTGMKIVSYYRSRFQIEFLYRDAKQHCGLEHCQARSKNKLNFHFNAALTSVNLAKMHWLDTRESKNEPFSMANFKTLCNNKLLLDRFICVFAINPNAAKNKQKIEELYNYGLIAA